MARARTVKKTYNLPPALVRRVKRIYKVKTETEAIIRCMEEAAFMQNVERAVRAVGGKHPDFKPLR
jgi:hypothetical protein